MVAKRSAKATAKIKPKKITSKQRRARKVNIEVARSHKKKGALSKTHEKVLGAKIEKGWEKGGLTKGIVKKLDSKIKKMTPKQLQKHISKYPGTGEAKATASYRKTRLYSDMAVHYNLYKK